MASAKAQLKEEAANHLRIMLHGMSDANGYLELRSFDEKQKDERNEGRSFFIPLNAGDEEIDGAVKWLGYESKRGRGVFVGVNPRVRESGYKRDVEQHTTVFLDLDTEKAKVTREEAIAAIHDISPIPPSIISDSGGGLHVLYFMKPEMDYAKWRDIQEALYDKFKDYGADRSVVTDSSRVLRLTPFPNWKYEKESGGRATKIINFTPREITPSADAVVDLFDVKRHSAERERFQLPEHIEAGGTDGEGRNVLLFKEASALRNRGYGFEEILDALTTLNEHRCTPPLPMTEVEHIAKNVTRYEPTYNIGDSSQFTLSRLGIAGTVENTFGYKFKEFLAVPFPPVEWVIHGLNQGELGELVAVPNAGKTTLCLGLSMSMAAGREYQPLYFGGEPKRVMYLDFENRGGFLQKDVRVMAENFDPEEQVLINENLFIAVDQEIYQQEMNLSNPDHLAIVVKAAEDHEADLIIIDTMAAGFSLSNENDNSEMEKVVIKPLKHLARKTGAAILVVHHKGKAAETGDQNKLYSGRGASSLAAAARLVLMMDHLKDGTGKRIANHIVLSQPKIKGVPFEDTVFELDFSRRWFEPADIRLADDSSNYEAVWSLVSEPMRRKQIVAAAKDAGLGISDSTIGRILQLGLANGRLKKGAAQGIYEPGDIIEATPEPETGDGEIVDAEPLVEPAQDSHDDAAPPLGELEEIEEAIG